MWIFGYGSLIWRPDFDHVERRVGYIEGWKRRFYQGSLDHRGVPGAPGRVVTLLAAPEAVCWGVAYRIEGAEAKRITDKLDKREQGGYTHHAATFMARSAEGFEAVADVLLYVATPDNPCYLGPASREEMVSQIATAVGPSGSNSEYLLRLAETLRAIAVDDPHVFELEELLRQRQRR